MSEPPGKGEEWSFLMYALMLPPRMEAGIARYELR